MQKIDSFIAFFAPYLHIHQLFYLILLKHISVSANVSFIKS